MKCVYILNIAIFNKKFVFFLLWDECSSVAAPSYVSSDSYEKGMFFCHKNCAGNTV